MYGCCCASTFYIVLSLDIFSFLDVIIQTQRVNYALYSPEESFDIVYWLISLHICRSGSPIVKGFPGPLRHLIVYADEASTLKKNTCRIRQQKNSLDIALYGISCVI